jgi:4-amino-4-deoxy-L-arabinose transferase-like glycosyltransferase
MKTRTLLTGGAVAGPLYVGIGTIEILFRPGFDIRRHALSLMSNGDLGWIQVASFIASGTLVIAGAVGVRRSLRGQSGAGWGPALLGLYGLGLIAAGCFVADPMDGFPIGTPPGPPVVTTWHGPLHFMAGGIGFFGLIGACLIFARHFATRRQSGWSAFSLATGVLFFAGFASIASGSKQQWVVPAFTAAVLLAWTWLTTLAMHLRETA